MSARSERVGVSRARRIERLTLVGMAVGVAFMLQPWWSDGMRVGFFVTLASTLAQIVFGHLVEDDA